eukprot:59726_1
MSTVNTLCIHFNTVGGCRRGSGCMFQHVPLDEQQQAALLKEIDCKHYANGNCKKGTRCPYKHGRKRKEREFQHAEDPNDIKRRKESIPEYKASIMVLSGIGFHEVILKPTKLSRTAIKLLVPTEYYESYASSKK